jgi:hypothetical protein
LVIAIACGPAPTVTSMPKGSLVVVLTYVTEFDSLFATSSNDPSGETASAVGAKPSPVMGSPTCMLVAVL